LQSIHALQSTITSTSTTATAGRCDATRAHSWQSARALSRERARLTSSPPAATTTARQKSRAGRRERARLLLCDGLVVRIVVVVVLLLLTASSHVSTAARRVGVGVSAALAPRRALALANAPLLEYAHAAKLGLVETRGAHTAVDKLGGRLLALAGRRRPCGYRRRG
jgi:hypothetical protein